MLSVLESKWLFVIVDWIMMKNKGNRNANTVKNAFFIWFSENGSL